VTRRNVLPVRIRKPGRIAVFLLAGGALAWAQTSSTVSPPPENVAVTAAVHDLQQEVAELRAAINEMRSEAAQYRAETAELRRELEAVAGKPSTATPAATANEGAEISATAGAAPPAGQQLPLEQRVASLEEASQLLNSKLDDQYQTKVESASKYRVRLSGIVLMNLFSNRGQIGPNLGNGNFGATLRQSEIGLEVFGPTLAGAKTSGSVQADFAGGFTNTWNGVNSGLFRLRTASMRLDWEDTAVVVGQDELFISPHSPTSFASLAIPALTYAGNLWAWTPQVRVEHRFDLSGDQSITLQGGILDNLTGGFPGSSYFRTPGAGESSGQPAYGFRTAWTTRVAGRPLTLGAAGYYTRQTWPFEHYTDGWAGLADWDIPLTQKWSLSGEFYRGRALGGIGGGVSRSVVYDGNPSDPGTAVLGLDDIGGWSQLKFKANSRLEFNAAFGLDNPNSAEVRAAAGSQQYPGLPLFVQNRSGLVNFVYRPRSNLLFSGEYLHLQSLPLYGIDNSAQQVNLTMGVLF